MPRAASSAAADASRRRSGDSIADWAGRSAPFAQPVQVSGRAWARLDCSQAPGACSRDMWSRAGSENAGKQVEIQPRPPPTPSRRPRCPHNACSTFVRPAVRAAPSRLLSPRAVPSVARMNTVVTQRGSGIAGCAGTRQRGGALCAGSNRPLGLARQQQQRSAPHQSLELAEHHLAHLLAADLLAAGLHDVAGAEAAIQRSGHSGLQAVGHLRGHLTKGHPDRSWNPVAGWSVRTVWQGQPAGRPTPPARHRRPTGCPCPTQLSPDANCPWLPLPPPLSSGAKKVEGHQTGLDCPLTLGRLRP